MIKKITLALVAFALTFSFTACGVESGEVYDKTYEPARSWQEEEPNYVYSCQYEYGWNPYTNKYEWANICKDRHEGYKTVTKHKEECYRLFFKNEDGDKGDACVGSERYEAIEIGDWFEE